MALSYIKGINNKDPCTYYSSVKTPVVIMFGSITKIRMKQSNSNQVIVFPVKLYKTLISVIYFFEVER